MIITYEGQSYPFDLDDVTVRQGMAIEKYMGCSFAEWGKRLQAGGDLRARQVLGWLILHPGGDVPIEETDFKLGKLGQALEAAYAAEAGDDEPVPTAAASNGRKRAASSQASSPRSSGETSP